MNGLRILLSEGYPVVLGCAGRGKRNCKVKLRFVENKRPDAARVADLLERCAAENSWANRGPLYRMLQDAYAEHLALPDDLRLVPMANGGVALEAMARLHAVKAGRKLRWVASAYSFQNLGRGYFSDVRFLDCDARGLLDAEALAALDPGGYDGVIATNPFGLYADFGRLAGIARAAGKAFLVDNAAGLHSVVPALPWQSFSLHHTKPYGVGEGGLALLPAAEAEAAYELVNYAPDIAAPEHWFENGKLSDIACAYQIDRLERVTDWGPRALEQRERVIDIAGRCGLVPLAAPETDIPMTSMPFLSEAPVPLAAVDATRFSTYAKYYRPLAALPRVAGLFDRLVNIPCHGDIATLSADQIAADIRRCMDTETGAPPGHADRPRRG